MFFFRDYLRCMVLLYIINRFDRHKTNYNRALHTKSVPTVSQSAATARHNQYACRVTESSFAVWVDLKKSGLFLFSQESTTENVVVYSALSAGTGAGAASFFSAATALAFLGLAAGA